MRAGTKTSAWLDGTEPCSGILSCGATFVRVYCTLVILPSRFESAFINSAVKSAARTSSVFKLRRSFLKSFAGLIKQRASMTVQMFSLQKVGCEAVRILVVSSSRHKCVLLDERRSGDAVNTLI